MHLVNCEHPTYIRDKRGDFISVRCNHCNTCQLNNAYSWIQRLDLESRNHKYCFMVFLSYDDEHVPCMFVSDDLQFVCCNRDPDYCIPSHELLSLCKDDSDFDYLSSRLVHPLGIPVCYPKDVSDFCKRFNKYLFSHVTHKYENFRYFFCHEYGPSTYRCHVHGLMWFDEDSIASRFVEVLRSCWTFGDCSGSAIYSDAGKSYVAQYVNMSMHLPSFYSHSKLRQKHQFSKFPSIGSRQFLVSEIREIYDELPIRRSIFNSRSSKFASVPVESSLKSRFFPKCQGYRDLSYSQRVGLYRAAQVIPSFDFNEFRSSLDTLRWLDFRGIINSDESAVKFYFDWLKGECSSSDAFENSLKRWFTLSKRICYFSNVLHTSVGWIVRRIDEFYKRLEYDNLKKFYEFQENYASRYSSAHLIWLYPDLCQSVRHCVGVTQFDIGFLDPVLYDRLESFGITQLSDLCDLTDTNDYKAMVSQSFKIYKDTHKRASVNAYRDGLLARRDPVLSKILYKYQVKNKIFDYA